MADAAEEIEKYEAETGSWARTAKDLFAGAAGGVAQVLLGKSRKLCPSKDFWPWVSSIIASAFMTNVEDWVLDVELYPVFQREPGNAMQWSEFRA
jgi:hypothetical protein